MINYIWAIFIFLGVIYSFINGNISCINNEIINVGSSAVEMIFKLIPLMCLWLGLMNIAKESGLLKKIAKFISPIVVKLFPEIPKESAAITLITTNIVMNMLGLGNAATPFGLKAMKCLQELNNNKDIASNSMITFLVINTASVTIIPTTVISFRIANGVSDPTDIMLASIITTFLSCLFGVVLDRLLSLRSRYV